MTEDSLNILRNRLREFAKEHDWDQFHSPKNLSMALIAEAALDIFYKEGKTNHD